MKSLDALRGFTIGGMILVNTPGTWEHIYSPLAHAQWNGMTPTDMVFPLFIYIMGISMYISLRKFNFQLHKELFLKILKRSFLIFIIGSALFALAGFFYALHGACHQENLTESPLAVAMASFSHLRILGVLQRLALCYGIGSIIVSTVRHKFLPALITGLLIVYLGILMIGNGFVYGPENILSKVDLNVLGANHIYNDHGIDPEGVLSTIPSIAHVLIGFCVGKICLETHQPDEKLKKLFIFGSILLIVGLLLQYVCPLNKKVWSPSFVCLTCGLSTSLLSLLYWFIDVQQNLKFVTPFEVFGVNSLFCYVFSQVLCVFFDTLPLQGDSIHDLIYNVLCMGFGDGEFSSFLYAAIFVLIVWLLSYQLYRKKIYIKL